MFGIWREIDKNTPKKEFDEFWNQLKDYVDLYVTFPKPRGKGGAPVINECTSSIESGLKALARAGKVDLVSDIFDKLVEGKEHLKGPNYTMWYERTMNWLREIDPNYCVTLFYLNKKACETFIRAKTTSINNIIDVAKCLYKVQDDKVKMEYTLFVYSIRGGFIEMDQSIYFQGEDGSEDYIIDTPIEDPTPILHAIEKLLDEVDYD